VYRSAGPHKLLLLLLLLLQGEAPGCKGSYVVLSGRLSDVRGFNDFLQDFLVQVGSRDGSACRTVAIVVGAVATVAFL
jgi:hypothetical protein